MFHIIRAFKSEIGLILIISLGRVLLVYHLGCVYILKELDWNVFLCFGLKIQGTVVIYACSFDITKRNEFCVIIILGSFD